MSHTIRDKQKLKARASKIQGQVVALKKMLDEGKLGESSGEGFFTY